MRIFSVLSMLIVLANFASVAFGGSHSDLELAIQLERGNEDLHRRLHLNLPAFHHRYQVNFHGQNLVLEHRAIIPDGDCGFYALEIDRERFVLDVNSVLDHGTLLSGAAFPKKTVRVFLGYEVFKKLAMSSPGSFDLGFPEGENKIRQAFEEALTDPNGDTNSIFRGFSGYLTHPTTLKLYLMGYYLKKPVGVSQKRIGDGYLEAEGALKLAAQMYNLNIALWAQDQEHQKPPMLIYTRWDQKSPVQHILLAGSHYDRLVDMSQVQSRIHLARIEKRTLRYFEAKDQYHTGYTYWPGFY